MAPLCRIPKCQAVSTTIEYRTEEQQALRSRRELINVVIHRRSIFALNFAIW
jgi:hypothetical protein